MPDKGLDRIFVFRLNPTAGRDFMVVGLDRNADFFQNRHHVGARGGTGK